MSARRCTAVVALAVVAGVPALASCAKTSKTPGRGAGESVHIKATNSECLLDRTTLPAGRATFTVSNKGSKTTEVYVYAASGADFTKVVGERENIGPGTTNTFQADLPAGSYEVACKPGQAGDGIRTKITVGSSSGESVPAATKYDREVELATDGKAITGLRGPAKRGEKVEFKLTNRATASRVLAFKDPTGAVAGQTQPIAPGALGEIVVALSTAGTWKVVVKGDRADDITMDLVVA